MDSDGSVQLLVDLSPAPPIPDAELRAWAAEQAVFISSVMVGMRAEREAAVAAIAAIGATPVWFEAFGGMDDDPEDAYLARVAASDIYLGILGTRYGKPLKTGYSATHAEYDEAGRRGLRISVWATDGELDGRQRDFLEEIRVFHTTGSYNTPDELRQRVERRLRELASEATAPWVKVGNTVLRSRVVRDDGKQITVVAQIRDNTIAANIERLRPDRGFGRDSETRITWPGGTAPVRVAQVGVETTTSKTRIFTIVANRVEESRSTLHDVTFEGRSPDDLTELAMRGALFAEPNPLGTMSFMAQVANPLDALTILTLPEDAISEIAALLVTESVVAERGADHVTAFRLGPAHRGVRRLELGWMPARRYTNVDPVERRIDGAVSWTS